MNRSEIQNLQKYLGVEPDGFWGPKSQAACLRHLRALMPSPNPWPSSSQAALRAFYGDPWDNSRIVTIPAPKWLRLYDGSTVVRTIQCHEKVAASLIRALQAAYEAAPSVASRYFGCHVDRKMRGGSSPSLHAYGAAIDLDASANGNKTHWPTRATMPFAVMEAFAREGWTPAGAFWNRDAMHFQATKP